MLHSGCARGTWQPANPAQPPGLGRPPPLHSGASSPCQVGSESSRKLKYLHQRALESDPGKLRLEAVRPARPVLAQCCGSALQQLARCAPSQAVPWTYFAGARVPYGSVCLCRCPDLHTMVLFVASLGNVKFLEIFLLQCHDKLSSLQVRTPCNVLLRCLCPGCTVSTAWHPTCQASRPSGLIPG